MDLFASAVPQYARYRSGYPADEVERLAAGLGLDGRSRVIDIGCGTGQLTLPLARWAGTVVALDPLAEMLTYGRAAAQAAGLANIAWVQGDSTQLVELIEPGAQLATFAASFHWMDRVETVATLDRLLAPGGSIVVINDDLGEAEQPDWAQAIHGIRRRYAGLEPAPGAIAPQPTTHREVLERSAFARIRSSAWSWTRQLSVDEVIGLQLSYSFSTPARLGNRVEEFSDEIRDAVLRLYPDGVVSEPNQVEVLVAARG